MFGRNKVAPLVAEFLSVAVLAMVVLSVANSRIGFPWFIASAAGVVVGLMTFLHGKVGVVSGNPALTVGLWSVRKTKLTNAVVAVAAQLLGAVAAWKLYEYLTNRALSNIAGKDFDWRVFAAEAIGAFIFVWGVSAAVQRRFDGWNLAVAAGSSLFLGMLVGSIAANGLVNPALAVGLQSISKAYILGPLAGGIVAATLYEWVFVGLPKVGRVSAPASRTTSRATSARKPARRTTTTRRTTTRRRTR